MFQINESIILEVYDGEGEYLVSCELAEFAYDNEIASDGEEYAAIVEALEFAGYYEGGGGAAASYVLIVSA